MCLHISIPQCYLECVLFSHIQFSFGHSTGFGRNLVLVIWKKKTIRPCILKEELWLISFPPLFIFYLQLSNCVDSCSFKFFIYIAGLLQCKLHLINEIPQSIYSSPPLILLLLFEPYN